jgi:hypothetical protein
MRVLMFEGYIFILLHGFNVRDRGHSTLDMMIPHLEGAHIVELDRDWEELIEAAIELKSEAGRLSDAAQKIQAKWPGHRIILLGHSHGCNIIREGLEISAWLREKVSASIFFNPAIRVDADLQDVPTCVFYSPSDTTVTKSKLLRLLPWRWFMPHPWGEGGRRGVRGAVNINLEEVHREKVLHSGAFATPLHAARNAEAMSLFLARPSSAGGPRPRLSE